MTSALKVKSIDMNGKLCLDCKKGKYKETTFFDDMDGVLHCDKCNNEVSRHTKTLSETH